jgi:transcriptional regulator NrdR family protein
MKALSRRILEAFEDVSAGELAPDRAHAMARLAAVYVQLHQVGELEARLEELERRAEQSGGKRWA